MNTLRVPSTTGTSVSWRDEISYSHEIRSEGLEQLKEALKQADLPTGNPEQRDGGSEQGHS
jgi:hypothetical protein